MQRFFNDEELTLLRNLSKTYQKARLARMFGCSIPTVSLWIPEDDYQRRIKFMYPRPEPKKTINKTLLVRVTELKKQGFNSLQTSIELKIPLKKANELYAKAPQE